MTANQFNTVKDEVIDGSTALDICFERIDPNRTHNRLMLVLNAIGKLGPVTMVEIEKTLPLSRAAIWRTVSAMRTFGWVRMRAGDKSLELTHKLDLLASQFHFSSPESEQFSPLFSYIQSLNLNYEFVAFVTLGKCHLVEASRPVTSQEDLSLLDDCRALVAQAALLPSELTRHIRHYARTVNPEEMRSVMSDQHQESLRKIQERGFAWSRDRSSVIVPLRSDSDTACAVRVEPKVFTRRAISTLNENLAAILEKAAEYSSTTSDPDTAEVAKTVVNHPVSS